MQPASRRIQGSSASSASARMRTPGGPASSRRMPAVQQPQPSGSTRQFQRGGGAPPPGPGGKKDNTPMIIGGVCVGALVLVGLGFAMSGKEPPKKKEPPKAVEKAPEPKKEEYDPWKDPAMMGSETDAAKRRKTGMNDQNKSGEVDRTKVGTDGK